MTRFGYSRRWPVGLDVVQPEDPSIPFFRTPQDYERRRHPGPPPGEHPDRHLVWLVEPGIQSIEAYETILRRTVSIGGDPPPPPLRLYICEAGVVQVHRRRPIPSRDVSIPPEADARLREPRDVCFTLVSMPEQVALAGWLQQHGLRMARCAHIATPLGCAMLVRPNPELRAYLCRRLGFRDESEDDLWRWQYPRSVLPDGVLEIGSRGVTEWSAPGDPTVTLEGHGLAISDEGARRVQWYSTTWG